MEIKYVKALVNKDSIRTLFEQINKTMPEGFEDFFKKYNGGRPTQNICFLYNGAEKVVNSFLSFNKDDKENIYKAIKRVSQNNLEIIPFASDPAGNYFCIKSNEIVFYSHEDEEIYKISNSFNEFIDNLK